MSKNARDIPARQEDLQAVQGAVEDLDTTAATLATEVTALLIRQDTATQAATVKLDAVGAVSSVGLVGGREYPGTTPRSLHLEFDGRSAMIDYEHHEIHAGRHFTWPSVDASVAIAAPRYWRIKAPDSTVRVHLHMDMTVGPSGGRIEVYEAPTITVDGAAGTPLNNDRNSAALATALVYDDPTVTVDGTLLKAWFVGVGGGPFRQGGSSETENELLLKRNTDYVVKFTSTANDTVAALNMYWYEEDRG